MFDRIARIDFGTVNFCFERAVAAFHAKGYSVRGRHALVIEFHNGTAAGVYRTACLYGAVYFGKSRIVGKAFVGFRRIGNGRSDRTV